VELSSDSVNELIGQIKENNSLLKDLLSGPTNSVDMKQVFSQLNSLEVDKIARHYYSWNFRLTELIKERSRRAAQHTYDFVDRELRHALYEVDQFKVINSKRELILENGVSRSGNIGQVAYKS